MIRKVEIENFMSLKDVSIELEPLTVFIGPNGSGKSAIFKAIVTLARFINGAPVRGSKTGEFAVESGIVLDDMVWSGNSGLTIKFRVWFAEDKDDEPGYTLELRKGMEGWSVTREIIHSEETHIEVDEDHPFQFPIERGPSRTYFLAPPLRATLNYLVQPFRNDAAARPVIEPVIQLGRRFGPAWRYRPSAIEVASFAKRPEAEGKAAYVRENGSGVAAELQDLQGSKREVFEAIEKAVCQLFPHIKAIGFKSDWRGVRLSFRTDRSEDLIPAPQESDGVLLATFLFWRLYTSASGYKVCLEEPENGLHPFLLADRFRVLKNFAYPKGDRPPVQLLVATHSPEFLRAVRAHPQALWKEIRLVEFNPGTGTSVDRLKYFAEATKLIDKYLDLVHESWEPLLRDWEQSEK